MPLLLLLAASACAARPKVPTLASYDCGGTTVTRNGAAISVGEGRAVSLDHLDHAGSHFVLAPLPPAPTETVELVLPDDPRRDGFRTVYDTAGSPSRAQWRVVSLQVCTAHDGYSDVLARWMRGATLDDLARDFSLADRHAARSLVHDALLAAQHRYYRDR